MPKYKLTYFNARGRAEVARLVMAYGDIEYEDIRVDREQWLQLKPKTPFGQLPLLEVDGDVICQSKAISRFLATETGLYGKSTWESAKIDMIVDCMEDYFKNLVVVFHEQDEERKKLLRQKYIDGIPANTRKVENLLQGEYFVGNRMTLADIYVVRTLDFPKRIDYEYNWDDFPNLKALRERVYSHPKIAAWIAKRPQTQT